MILYPAIDLMGGRVVRLAQGRFDDATTYSSDPAEALAGFAGAGADWAHIRSITLTPFGPSIGTVAKSSKDYAALWLFARDSKSEDKAKVTVSGLQSGTYKVTWWDTENGKVLSEESVTAANGAVAVNSPPIQKDIAGWISKTNERTARQDAKKPAKATK